MIALTMSSADIHSHCEDMCNAYSNIVKLTILLKFSKLNVIIIILNVFMYIHMHIYLYIGTPQLQNLKLMRVMKSTLKKQARVISVSKHTCMHFSLAVGLYHIATCVIPMSVVP